MAYHRASRLVKVAAGRPPVLLDESMVTAPRGAVRNTVRDMAAARRRAAEAVGFVPPQDLNTTACRSLDRNPHAARGVLG